MGRRNSYFTQNHHFIVVNKQKHDIKNKRYDHFYAIVARIRNYKLESVPKWINAHVRWTLIRQSTISINYTFIILLVHLTQKWYQNKCYKQARKFLRFSVLLHFFEFVMFPIAIVYSWTLKDLKEYLQLRNSKQISLRFGNHCIAAVV